MPQHISSSEAATHILGFVMQHMMPVVTVVNTHLECEQHIFFSSHHVSDVTPTRSPSRLSSHATLLDTLRWRT